MPAFRPRFRRGRDDSKPEREPSGPTGEPLDEEADRTGDPGGDASGTERDDDHDGDPIDDAAGDDEWLAYEFHEWSLESRVMLAQLLTADKVVHSWQGTTLLIHESLEETVDSLVDEVEETERAKEAISRPIGPEDELTAFELGEWPEELRAELVERLVQARVPHILDEAGSDDGAPREENMEAGEVCDLLVREADEERVELVIDDLLAREEEASLEELEGLEVNELLSNLFVACDRLRRNPGDADGVRGVTIHARRITGVRTPFGFAAPDWRNLRNAAGELLDLVEGEDTDADDLRELAHRMSDTLRMLV